jgi:hypothetical protein
VSGGTVQLHWQNSEPGRAAGFYHVLRSNYPGGDVHCATRLNGSADNCALYTDSVATTTATSFTDRPPAGTWTYRIGIAANWLDDPKLGDVYVVGTPVTVTAG